MGARWMAVLVLVLALAACRADGPPQRPPTAETPTEKPMMVTLSPEQVERSLPSTDAARWDAAYDTYVAEARFPEAWTRRDGFRCRLAPVVDPSGASTPCLLEVRHGNTRSVQLVHDGALVPINAGADAAERFLADIGFPSTQAMSWQLFGELMRYFGLMTAPSGAEGQFYPLVHRWEDLDAFYASSSLPLPTLKVDGGTAEFTAQAEVTRAGEGGGETEPTIVRRVISISNGKLKITDWRREQQDWRPWTR